MSNIKKIADRVLERMTFIGIEQPELARRCNVDQSQISRLISGKIIRIPSYMYELAKALETSVQWLKTGIGEDQQMEGYTNVHSPILGIDPINTHAKSLPVKLIPVYGAVIASMPGLVRFTDEYMIDQTPPHPGIANTKDSFAMQVQGDSMSPRREHGELIYIHPYKEPLIGQDCVVVDKKDGSAIYKRYMGRSKDGKSVLLRQFNPANDFSVPLEKIYKIYSVIF